MGLELQHYHAIPFEQSRSREFPFKSLPLEMQQRFRPLATERTTCLVNWDATFAYFGLRREDYHHVSMGGFGGDHYWESFAANPSVAPCKVPLFEVKVGKAPLPGKQYDAFKVVHTELVLWGAPIGNRCEAQTARVEDFLAGRTFLTERTSLLTIGSMLAKRKQRQAFRADFVDTWNADTSFVWRYSCSPHAT